MTKGLGLMIRGVNEEVEKMRKRIGWIVQKGLSWMVPQ